MKKSQLSGVLIALMIVVTSCSQKNISAYSYSLSYNIEEPDNWRQDFISYKNCLIQFVLQYNFETTVNVPGNKTDIGIQNSASSNYSFDTLSVLISVKNSKLFYQFDRFSQDAQLINKGITDTLSIAMKLTMDSAGSASHVDIKSAQDVVINNIPFKKIDSAISIENNKGIVSMFYLKSKGFVTVFNINNQIKNIGEYCFAGYLFSLNNSRVKEGVIISKYEKLDSKNLAICESLYQKATK